MSRSAALRTLNRYLKFARQRRLLAEWLPESLLIALVLAFLVGMLVACVMVDAMSTRYVGAPHPPLTDPGRIHILRAQPTLVPGEIVVDASTELRA